MSELEDEFEKLLAGYRARKGKNRFREEVFLKHFFMEGFRLGQRMYASPAVLELERAVVGLGQEWLKQGGGA